MYPVPFADVDDAVELAVTAERLGFDSVWGNDHVSTQHYVRSEFDEPPRFYDPLTYLAYVAALTTTLRLATCVLVLPFRHPVVAAKQAATLDQLSGGRLVLGVGIGAYRGLIEEGLDAHMVSVSGQLDLRYVPFGELVNAETMRTAVRFIAA
ncbi:MAG: LLM class flavin-dependent oxidoreductase, partial [Acidobacteria bacterium]|nr:LLM class flavin-dependent oxidoreductase [Acidobacteriota bacterium]